MKDAVADVALALEVAVWGAAAALYMHMADRIGRTEDFAHPVTCPCADVCCETAFLTHGRFHDTHPACS